MKATSSLLERVRIASPCPANWEQMSGDERVRFCGACNLHVYNISQMSRREAMSLIRNTEGRICAKIYRRADGTVLTRDCPVGLRAIRRRVARLATAVAVLVTTVCGNVFAVSGRRTPNTKKRGSFTDSIPSAHFSYTATVSGTITDPNGAPIPNATVRLTSLKTNQQRVAKANKRGEYHLFVGEFGQYTLTVEAEYFEKSVQFLEVHLDDELRLDVSMMIAGALVGVIVIQPVRGKGFEVDGVHVRIN